MQAGQLSQVRSYNLHDNRSRVTRPQPALAQVWHTNAKLTILLSGVRGILTGFT